MESQALPCTYVVWFHKRPEGKSSAKSWEDSLKQVAHFSTLQEFWHVYQWLARPNDLEYFSSYYVVRRKPHSVPRGHQADVGRPSERERRQLGA